MKKIVVLGSTGSIGRAALEVIRSFPERFRIIGLATGSNIELIQRQADEFRPSVIAVAERESALKLKGGAHRILPGTEGLIEIASHPEADFVLSAISGSAGLLPSLSAIRAGKTVGLANKETLVMAGSLIRSELLKHNARVIPVDSEHSAIFQCLHGHSISDVERLILTASGGPFHGKTRESLRDVTPEDALNHPTWRMGKKITIDSSTLMNKGLEVIEAHYLFGPGPERIDVVIHPQSIVHSLVEFKDGSLLAHLSQPDMKGPIAYALSYPERLEGVLRQCRLDEIGTLTFEKPDVEQFPCLRLAYESLKAGGTATAVLNASNEMAVDAFIRGLIPFTRIPVIIEELLSLHIPEPLRDIETVIGADSWAREKFKEIMEEM